MRRVGQSANCTAQIPHMPHKYLRHLTGLRHASVILLEDFHGEWLVVHLFLWPGGNGHMHYRDGIRLGGL